VILPRKTVLELGKLLADVDNPVTIDILANQVRFGFANVELTSKVVDSKFPISTACPDRSCEAIELPRLWNSSAARRRS
jgi:DNA polymerase-3 subunit beta